MPLAICSSDMVQLSKLSSLEGLKPLGCAGLLNPVPFWVPLATHVHYNVHTASHASFYI